MINHRKASKSSDVLAVVSLVRKHIVKHRLGPGDRLPTHQELCEDLGVGLRRLREGLSILRQQGVIETNRKAGTVVKHPSAKVFDEPIGWQLEELGCSFEDLVRARAVMESAAAAEAAKFRTPRDLLIMLDATEAMKAVGDDCPEHEQHDEAFHMAVLQSTGNPAVLMFGKLIAGQFRRKREEDHIEPSSSKQKVSKTHRAIFEAIDRKDSEAARTLMYDHVMWQLQMKKRCKKSKRSRARR